MRSKSSSKSSQKSVYSFGGVQKNNQEKQPSVTSAQISK